MAEKEGYEGKTMKLLPLSTGPRFSWMNWKAYLFIFAATIVLGKEVLLTNFSLVVETAAQKTARIAKYAVANAAIVFAIYTGQPRNVTFIYKYIYYASIFA